MGSTSAGRGRPGRRHGVRRWAAILGTLGLACAPSGTGGEPDGGPAASRPDPVSAAQPPLRVGTSGDYTPFSQWPAGQAEPEGFSVDVARAFAKASGRRIEWVRFTWPALRADHAAGRFDLVLSGITIRPDRSLAGRFSLPLTETGAVALVAGSSTARSQADLDRPAVRIAVNRGGHLEQVARTLFPHAAIEALPDNAAVPRRLAEGRADAVLTDTLEAPHWQASLPGARAIGPFTRDRKAAWFPVGGEALARDFDRWLLGFEAEDGLAALRARHGLAGTRTAAPRAALLASLDERLSLMSEVARAKAVLARRVEDAAQEERVHAAFREAIARAAAARGAPPPADTAVRRFVEAQLRAARFVQSRTLAAIPAPTAAPAGEAERAAARRALDDRIRPALAFITERIAGLVVAARPGAAPSPEVVSQALARHALPAALEAELHAALGAVLEPAARPDPSARGRAPAPRARSAPRGRAPSA